MPKIYLARHGQDEDNAAGILNGRRDNPLTSVGIEQAQILAKNIAELKLSIQKIYSSPLQRAHKTAEIISDVLGVEKPQKHDLLAEREYGKMTGQRIVDIEKLCAPHILKCNPITYFLTHEGAESFPEVKQRAGEFLEWLKINNESENVLLVCHGDIGKMLYGAFYNLDWKDVLIDFHFGNSELLLLDTECTPENRHVVKMEQHNH